MAKAVSAFMTSQLPCPLEFETMRVDGTFLAHFSNATNCSKTALCF